MADPSRPTRASERQAIVGSDDTVPASYPPDDDVVATVPKAERYRLGAELGRGGMGRVVEAFDVQLGRTVALKEVLPRGGAGIARRFAREVQITARLEHASIVPLYDSGVSADGRPFYVMRRVSGRPLDEMILRARGLGERLALLPAMLAAIDAVAHAHRRGVIHRDLKPANILVGELGETVVIDWGLAKVIGEDDEADDGEPVAADSLQTQLGSVFGTPGFMPPEQARGEELGTRGDVYALGATLYQMLAAKPPHSGKSATEVLDSTRNHELAPLTDECPGAPPELVAIVEKALAFDATARYPNAAALGEDVRRFLTGQLVAAHRYTKRQRLGRFTRRHRAPLGVAALAMVSVAVLAWIGVHRIIVERDAATLSREEAQRQEARAVDAQKHLTERQDALIVLHASTMLDTNPTESLAVLKQLTPSSARLVEAAGIARAAVVRGVAWAMQTGEELTTSLELSPDASRLAQTTRDGMVRIWDLDRRRLMSAKHFADMPHAVWVKAGQALLVTSGKQAPQLLEVSTGAIQPLPFPPLRWVTEDDAGARLAAIDKDGNALVLDMASLTATAIWPGHKVQEANIAFDGSWLLLQDAKTVMVTDPTGKELTHYDGNPQSVVASMTNKLAVLDNDQIHEVVVGPDAKWTTLPPARPHTQVLLYRGDRLVALSGALEFYEGRPGGYRTLGHVDPISFPMMEASDDRLVVASDHGVIHVFDGLAEVELHLPGSVSHLRMIARRNKSRLVAVSDGLILDYNLDDATPRLITARNAQFVDDDTILLFGQFLEDWSWYDIPSRKLTPFHFEPHGIGMIWGVDPLGGRVLVKEVAGRTSRLLEFDKRDAKQSVICEGRDVDGRMIPGGGMIYSCGDGRILATLHGEPGHEVVKLDGPVASLILLGNVRYGAASRYGELVRGSLETGAVERTHLDSVATAFLGADQTGRALVVADNRLLLWDQDLVEIATFPQSIMQVGPVAGGVMVALADHESLVLELRPGATPHVILPATHDLSSTTSQDGTVVAGPGTGGQVIIVDLPARTRWTLPVHYDSTGVVELSPNGRLLLQHGDNDHFMVWTLPTAGAELASWLDELTNATEDPDGILLWPWQRTATAP